jgi:type IV pilus assembly protein PilN
MPRINLLPWRDADRRRRRQEFLLGAVAALAAAGLVWLVVNWQFQAAIDYQNERNQLLRNEIAELDKQITEIVGLEQQKQRLIARMEVIEQLQRSRPEVVHLFDQLARTLPDGVYLTSVKQNNRRVQLDGFAQSSTRVSTYMRNIDSSEWLTDPALQVVETKGSGDAGARFTLFANQVGLTNPDDADAGAAPARPQSARPGAKAGARR